MLFEPSGFSPRANSQFWNAAYSGSPLFTLGAMLRGTITCHYRQFRGSLVRCVATSGWSGGALQGFGCHLQQISFLPFARLKGFSSIILSIKFISSSTKTAAIQDPARALGAFFLQLTLKMMMNASRTTARRLTQQRLTQQQQVLFAPRRAPHLAAGFASSAPKTSPGRGGGKFVGFLAIFGVAAAGTYYYPQLKEQFAAAQAQDPVAQPPKVIRPQAELQFEQPREQALSKEDNRELLSSQHLQVKQSWEHPGVYVWGSNVGKVVDPASSDKYVKLPRRLSFFNDQLLRDLKLTQQFGAAVTENGDLVQWGLGFSSSDPSPVTTLNGKDLVKLEVSADSIIALAKNGSVYSIPSSLNDQSGGNKQDQKPSAWSLWGSSSSGKESISFRTLTPSALRRGERITDISSGLEHCLFLTSKGRVFASASTASAFPSKGQMGIPGLTWETRPDGPYDQAHEISAIAGLNAVQIATGDYHSVIMDKTGKVFAFGENMYGQLGFEPASGTQTVETPTVVPISKLYGKGYTPTVTSIAAGGMTSFFAIDSETPLPKTDNASAAPASRRMPRVVSDLWAAGQGTYGSLGNGKWTHVTSSPQKVKALSSLFEFDEKKNMMIPIKVKSLRVGTTHAAAILGNGTETSTSSWSSENATNYGADALFWGGNEHYQLGTGKRSNLNTPSYIGPLDGGEADARKGRQGELHRLCLTPRQTARIGQDGKGRKVTLEQKIECGRLVTGVYSAV